MAAAHSAAEAGERGRLARAARTLGLRGTAELAKNSERLASHGRTLDAHDPQRTLERGYALVADADEQPIVTAEAARREGRVVIRFADDAVGAEIERDGSDEHT